MGDSIGPEPPALEEEGAVGPAHPGLGELERAPGELEVARTRDGCQGEGADRLSDVLAVDRVDRPGEVLRGAVGEEEVASVEVEPARVRLLDSLLDAGKGILEQSQRVEDVAGVEVVDPIPVRPFRVTPRAVAALVGEDEADPRARGGQQLRPRRSGVQPGEQRGGEGVGVVDGRPVTREVTEVGAAVALVQPDPGEEEVADARGLLEGLGPPGRQVRVEQGVARERGGDRVRGPGPVEEESRLDVEVIAPAWFGEGLAARLPERPRALAGAVRGPLPAAARNSTPRERARRRRPAARCLSGPRRSTGERLTSWIRARRPSGLRRMNFRRVALRPS